MDSIYDLTGEDAAFRRSDRRFVVFKSAQVISFGEPVYASSIRVYKLHLDSGVSPTQLQLGAVDGWTFNVSGNSSNLDLNAMSEAKLREPTFGDNLLHSIVMTAWDDVGGQYIISVEYQAFTKSSTQLEGDNIGPQYTPGMMRALIQSVDFLLQVKNPLSSVTSDTISSLNCLEVDPTGLTDANHILNEQHTVNVPAGQRAIGPVAGSFYKHDLVLTRTVNNVLVTLVENTDYVVLGNNMGKTKVAYHNSGVYDYIMLLTPIVGVINVSYRAFGGTVSRLDINVIRDAIIDLNSLLRNSSLLTETSLGGTPLMRDIRDRLDVLEEIYRHYPAVQFQMAAGPAEAWVDVAQIAHDAWSDTVPPPEAANGEFKVEVLNADYVANISIRYNVNSTKPLAVVANQVDAPTYEQDRLSVLTNRVIPKFRLVWMGDDPESNFVGLDQGLMLQMSVSKVEQATVAIKLSDYTGSASIWKLINTGAGVRPTANGSTTLPSSFVWNSGGGELHKLSNTVVVYDEAYTVWLGSMNIVDIEAATAGYIPARLTITGTDVPMNQIKAFRFTVYDRFTRNIIRTTTAELVTGINTTSLRGASLYDLSDLCVMWFDLTYTAGVGYTGKIISKAGSYSKSNARFDLRQIEVMV